MVGPTLQFSGRAAVSLDVAEVPLNAIMDYIGWKISKQAVGFY